MNILFLDQLAQIGGAQLCLVDLLPAVLGQGWRAIVAAPSAGPLQGLSRDAGAVVRTLEPGKYPDGRKSLRDGWRYVQMVPRMASEIDSLCDEFAVDLVYVNGPRLLPVMPWLNYRGPILYHSHVYLPPRPSRLLALWALRQRKIEIVAVSHVAASWHSKLRYRVIANGVADFSSPRTASQPPRVGYVGRIVEEKGVAEFMEAAKFVRTPCRFRIYGNRTAAVPAYLARLDRIGGPAEFQGWRDNLTQVFSEIDLVAVPSMVKESFGRTIVEAFSAGVPVVAFSIGAIPELIADEVTGFLTRERTPQALAERMDQVLAAPEHVRIVTANARRAWEERYTLERCQRNMIEAIASIAQQGLEAQRR